MSSGDESIDIPDEIDLIEEVEGEVDNPIETIEDQAQEETTQNNENKDSDDEDSSKKVVKPKRVVRNPQPKLNEQTLRTSKGLPALPGHFKRVKFKGRGHEEHDLNVLMKTYEYWCHRLYPKFPFDACVARLESLGSKRGTQVLMKKIRLGMDIGDEDKKVVSDEEKEDDIPTTEGFVDTFDTRFDQLLTGTGRTERPVEPETTEEQLERIRQNRLRAEALRKQRLEKMRASTQNEANTTSNSSERTEISTQSNIFNSDNGEAETSTTKQSERNEKPLNDSSDEERTVSQKSSRIKRTQAFLSDEEEMPVDIEKSTSEVNKNDNSIHRKKIQRIESDDEMETNESDKIRTENSTQGATQTDDKEGDNDGVGLDNIMSTVNEDTENVPGRNGTLLNTGDKEEKKTTSNGNANSSQRKKIRTIDSDDEMETNERFDASSQSNIQTEICTQSVLQSDQMDDENEEVDFDKLLSIVNEDDPISRSSDQEETNKTTSFINPRRKRPQTIESDDEMDIPATDDS